MKKFIQIPNLPSGRVTSVFMDACACPEAADAIAALGVEVISSENDNGLSLPLSRHADMLAHHLGGNVFVLAPSQTLLKSRLDSIGAHTVVLKSGLKATYPGDIPLNFARVKNFVFGRSDVMPPELTEYFRGNNIKAVHVRQGYAKCSTAIADENSIITADLSIAAAAKENGVDVLVITPEYIKLQGFDSGFIGGCCGKLSRNTMAFTGDIALHPDGNKIYSFLAERGINAVCLSDGMLTDIGGMLPLQEYL